ncbi:unnamed protein product [marine sediment metagenome]|uniref:Uncharacterized protein n=1 Tax=marine sediment metagenome TaxID=412755 RepID=X0RMZ1_9ZZZZ
MMTVNIIETEYYIFDYDSETGLWTAYRQTDGAEVSADRDLKTVMADAAAVIVLDEL